MAPSDEKATDQSPSIENSSSEDFGRVRRRLKVWIPDVLGSRADMSASARDLARELFRTYSIGIETLWTVIGPAVGGAKPEIAERIGQLLKAATAKEGELSEKRHNLYIAEQLMGEVLPIERLIAEGERRLAEGKTLKMPSVDEWKQRWDEATDANPQKELVIRAIYVTLIDELQQLYTKRSLDQKSRWDRSKPLLTRAATTFLLCAAPYIVVAIGLSIGLGRPAFFTDGLHQLITGGYIALSFGMLGAVFSRMLAFQTNYATLDYDDIVNRFAGQMLSLRQIVGGIGALILYFAIIGDLIGGKLFPNPDELFNGSVSLGLDPEIAKLVVWSFLGGFSERLVPDFLTRTEATAATADKPN